MKNIILLFGFLIFMGGCSSSSPVKNQEVYTLAIDDSIINGLRTGNLRFTSHQRIHPRQSPVRVQELAKGQNPEVVVVSCSDSRVPPEHVFDQGLGDLFTVRTAGHALDAISIASIEYAVENLGSRVILIMGHTSCGAVKAAISSKAGSRSGSKNIDQLISKIKPGLKGATSSDPKLYDAAVANVDASLIDLKKRSPLIRAKVERGEVKLVGALYDLSSGDVELWSF